MSGDAGTLQGDMKLITCILSCMSTALRVALICVRDVEASELPSVGWAALSCKSCVSCVELHKVVWVLRVVWVAWVVWAVWVCELCEMCELCELCELYELCELCELHTLCELCWVALSCVSCVELHKLCKLLSVAMAPSDSCDTASKGWVKKKNGWWSVMCWGMLRLGAPVGADK